MAHCSLVHGAVADVIYGAFANGESSLVYALPSARSAQLAAGYPSDIRGLVGDVGAATAEHWHYWHPRGAWQSWTFLAFVGWVNGSAVGAVVCDHG